MKQAAAPGGQGMTGTPRGKGWAFHLTTAALVIGIGLTVVAVLFILFSLSGSLLWFIPWMLRVIVGFVLIVLALLAAGMLAARTPLPRRWLLLVAAGALLLLSPLLMLWLHGAWDARYEVPTRSGGQLAMTVQEYAWAACALGLIAVVGGVAGWITARSPRNRPRAQHKQPRA